MHGRGAPIPVAEYHGAPPAPAPIGRPYVPFPSEGSGQVKRRSRAREPQLVRTPRQEILGGSSAPPFPIQITLRGPLSG